MGTIDEIEIYLKSQISYYHSQKYDAEGYTDSTNYNSKHNHNTFLQRVSACIAENQRSCPLFLNPFTANYVKRGEHIWCLILRSMFKLYAVVPHVETVVLLTRTEGTTSEV